MTLDEFLTGPDAANPCPIKLNDTFWINRLQKLLGEANNYRLMAERLDKENTDLENRLAGAETKLKLAHEALAAKVIAAEKATGTRPAKKKRPATRRSNPAPRGVRESG